MKSALQQIRDAGGPAGLMRGAEAAAGFGVEVFVEKELAAFAASRARMGAA
jgi:hypothetical protein